MLKDIFSKFIKQPQKEAEPIKFSVMDGFVDIKGYKVLPDGGKKLIYHDCGDNVVTDWMRHTIMLLLTGCVFSSNGNRSITDASSSGSRNSSEKFSFLGDGETYHSKENRINLDGYLLNGSQYFFDYDDLKEKYSRAASSLDSNVYAYFPTKVLFGTGKEYSSWAVLQSENETANATWYAEQRATYGGDTAETNFNSNISMGCNSFSGSISKNIYSGNGTITKMRTVNDPDTSSSIISTTSTMNKDYGVVGAIKSPYFDKTSDSEFLQTTITDSGKLLKPLYRGIGRPAFIYFNAPQSNSVTKEGWDSSSAEVSLSKDENSSYLNKITFAITMPAQTISENAVGEYYPHNGYNLKQIGLYNDAWLATGVDASNDANSYPFQNMQHGMLLAKKNITTFQKTADVELKLTWTLTI